MDLPKFKEFELILIWLLSSCNANAPKEWVYECKSVLGSGDAGCEQRGAREAK